MAETKLINFRHGTYDEIHGLGKDANCIYFASDKPLFYAVGKWHGIASMTSEVDRVNSKTILKINGDGGYAINCEIEGETLSKDLKEKLINAYEFVQLISGEDEDAIINKWNDIVAFLQGFGEADKLLNVVVELQNNLADEVANRISADLKHTEDIKSITDLVNDMFTLVDKGDGTKFIQSKYGFASDSFISARGVDEESSGVGGLDAQAVWDLLMQNDDATKIINVAHIPDITVAKITDFTAKVGDLIANKADKAATLSGYGITDAVTLNTDQNISGAKTFSNGINFGSVAKITTLYNQYLALVSGGNEMILTGGMEALYINSRTIDGAILPSLINFCRGSISDYASVKARVFISTVETGTAPLSVVSTTKVTNLNAEMVDGLRGNKLMRYLVRDKYLSAQLIGEESKKAAETFIEYWGESGWYNSKWGWVEALNGFKGDLTGNAASASVASAIKGIYKINFDANELGVEGQKMVYYSNFYYSAPNLPSNIGDDWDSGLLHLGTLPSGAYAQLLFASNGNLYHRKVKGSASDWKQLAFTDSNVASAQALTHSNGTVGAIVAENGRLEKVSSLYNTYGVGVKIAQGTIPTSVGDLSPAVVFGLQDAIQSSYGTAIWGTTDGKGHIQVGRLDKTNTAYSLCLQEFGGNVGIGTASPTAKLHVNGDSIINGKLTVANQLSIGNATIYWDVANQCLRVNSGIASDSFLSAKGIDTTGNGQGGGGGFDATMLWNELTIPSPTNSGKTIMPELLPNIGANKITGILGVDNIPTLTSAKISDFNSAVATAMASTLSDISSNLSNHEQRLQTIERALTWQGVS